MSKITDKLFRNKKIIFEDRDKNIKVSEPEIPGDPVVVERIDKNRDLKLDLNNQELKRYIIKDGKINFKIKDNS